MAGIRLHDLDLVLRTGRRGPAEFPCRFVHGKGDELGWFEHGSTIIVFAPPGFERVEGLCAGVRVRAGEPLLRLPA